MKEALKSDVASVVIGTPAGTHHESVRAVILAVKDVLVEKPMALNYEQAGLAPETLCDILYAFARMGEAIVFPIHLRTR